jgi:hypothetical protein
MYKEIEMKKRTTQYVPEWVDHRRGNIKNNGSGMCIVKMRLEI